MIRIIKKITSIPPRNDRILLYLAIIVFFEIKILINISINFVIVSFISILCNTLKKYLYKQKLFINIID